MVTYHTVIWDWNGTLLDDVDLALGIANEIFADYGVPQLTTERYTQIFDFPVRSYYERAGLELSQVDFEAVSKRFCDEFEANLHKSELFPSVTGLLSTISRSGKRQFVLSGTEQQALCRMISAFDLGSNFDGIKGMSDRLAHGKISAAQELVHEYQIEPAGTLMVGDTTHDFEVAENLGLDCALLSTGHQSYERLIDTDCLVFRSLNELRDHLVLND